MSKFGGGSSSSNSALLTEEQRREAEASRKEDDRQERLRSGRERIQAMFAPGGGTYTPAKTWEEAYADVPETLTKTQYFGNGAWSDRPQMAGGSRGYYTNQGKDQVFVPGSPGTPSYTDTREVDYANPNYVKTGDWVQGEGGEDVAVGGIGQDFFDEYTNAITSHYSPEITQQHREAKRQNVFDKARRGLLRSSANVKSVNDIERERIDANTELASMAEGQVSNLKSDLSNAEKSALNLLTSTEDPTTAANAALTDVSNITTRGPDLSQGLGNLFANLLTSYGSYQDTRNARRYYEPIANRSPSQSTGRGYA